MSKASALSKDGIPLQAWQVEAACRIHGQLPQWQLSEAALLQLHERMPGFDGPACLLKSVAVNAIYGTQVYAIVRMSRWIEEVMQLPDLTGPELVEKISNLPKKADTDKGRRFISFAAKFCHFFIDEECYPIYDEAARNALKLHLGGAYISDESQPYVAFYANFFELYRRAGLTCSARELDHYLWLSGMYMRWLKHRDRPATLVNSELLDLFNNPGISAADLGAMLPSSLERPFV